MNAVPDVEPLDYDAVEAEVTARDREVVNKFTKDSQITAIRGARAFWLTASVASSPAQAHRPEGRTADRRQATHSDPLSRWAAWKPTLIRGRSRRRQCVRRALCCGEAAGFGGGGVHGYRSLEGTFLGGCVFSGRAAAGGGARRLEDRRP